MRKPIILSVLAICLASLVGFSNAYPQTLALTAEPLPAASAEPLFHTVVAANTVDLSLTATPAQIRKAINNIYADIEMPQLFDAGAQDIEKMFHLTGDMVDEYYIRYASGRFGVADVCVIKPAPGKLSAVVTALETRREDRIREFESYRIHNSDGICRDAQIVEMGGYVVLAMIENEESALQQLRDTLVPVTLDPETPEIK